MPGARQASTSSLASSPTAGFRLSSKDSNDKGPYMEPAAETLSR